jgi:branched-chain amino acid transport system permease protein
MIAVVVLGGLGSVYGALVGAAILYTLPELVEKLAPYLPLVTDGATGAGLSPEQFTSVLYGAALIVVMVIEPRGLAALVTRVSDRSHHATTRKETVR